MALKNFKVPVRKCVGCGGQTGKKELIRIVRNKEGCVSLDLTGKKAGRGAYICKDPACLATAIKRKSLARAFKAEIPDLIYNQLRELIEVENNAEHNSELGALQESGNPDIRV